VDVEEIDKETNVNVNVNVMESGGEWGTRLRHGHPDAVLLGMYLGLPRSIG
jgi:hypothetical protein